MMTVQRGIPSATAAILAAAAMITVLFAGCGGTEEYVIASKGSSAYAIVVSGQASPSEKHAAEELARFIGEASGADIPVVGENDPRAQESSRIFVGAGALADNTVPSGQRYDPAAFGVEDFAIRTVVSGKTADVVIAGGRLRGTMYGVYEFMERLGFQWYTKEITRFPDGGRIAIAALDTDGSPAFMYRVPYIHDAFDSDWAARNRVHSSQDSLNTDRGGTLGILGSHTFDRLIPMSLYNEHPEYFPLIGGKRVTGYVQRCLSNPDVVKVAAENMIAWMDSEPRHTIFSLGQNDVEKLCECPECRKILEEQGAPSGLFVHFANQVAEIVAEKHPDKYMAIFAYTFSEKPPKNIRPHPMVIVRMAPIKLCFGHPFPECSSEPAREFRANLDGWSKVCDRIFVWHYCTDFSNYLMPFPDFREFMEDCRNYYERGVKGIYFQGTYTTDHGADSELRAWVMSRLLWDPYRDSDALVDEWLRGVYGPAYGPMRVNHDLIQARTAPPENHLYIYDPPTKEMWPDTVIASMDSLHDEAEKLAANDPTALRQVRKNRLTVEYLKLILNTGVLEVVGDVYKPVDGTATVDEYDRFIAKTKDFGMAALREEGMDGSFYTQFRQRMEIHSLASIENDDLRIDAVPVLGGRIVRILDKATGKNIVHTGDSYYNYYPVYGGYDEITAWGWNCSGYSNVYDADVKGRSMTLTARNPNGLVFSRTVTLPEKGRTISFVSSIKNSSDRPQTYRMTIRMPLETPVEGTTLEVMGRDGSFGTAVPTEEYDFFWPYHLREMRFDGERKPSGVWKLTSVPEGWTVVSRFDPNTVESCVWHHCKAKDMIRLDLHTVDREVSPGEAVTVRHSWEIR